MYPLNLLCPLCGQHEDTESKLLTCIKIKECLPEISSVVIQYDDVLGQDTDKIVTIGKLYHKVMEVRKQLLDK